MEKLLSVLSVFRALEVGARSAKGCSVCSRSPQPKAQSDDLGGKASNIPDSENLLGSAPKDLAGRCRLRWPARPFSEHCWGCLHWIRGQFSCLVRLVQGPEGCPLRNLEKTAMSFVLFRLLVIFKRSSAAPPRTIVFDCGLLKAWEKHRIPAKQPRVTKDPDGAVPRP